MRTVFTGEPDSQTPLARHICERSLECWGSTRPTVIVGRHPTLAAALERLRRLAESDAPVLITGDTGTGKELFARGLYLLSDRTAGPFLSVNCAQYREGQLIASELFGHRKGSFTGAVADHSGLFETAHQGVLFLDEIGDLSLEAQAMLLRALGENEIIPVGDSRPRRVDVRIVAATNRDLRTLVDAGRFRADLYYRLRSLQLKVPAVRERGDDWGLILRHYLGALNATRCSSKAFSREAIVLLSTYSWPGNVRELKGLVETGFHLSDSDVIEPRDFIESLEAFSRAEQLEKVPLIDASGGRYEQMASGAASFWEVVYRPYLRRELSRAEVRDVVARGLTHASGSYKRLLDVFGVDAQDYLKFMDFLRHHQLKPAERRRGAHGGVHDSR
jgi:DNA-binding NtrC family response regulator